MIHMRDMKNKCPECGQMLQFGSGCYHCPDCGYGKCGRVRGAARVSLLAVMIFFFVYGVVGYLEQEPPPVVTAVDQEMLKIYTQRSVEQFCDSSRVYYEARAAQ